MSERRPFGNTLWSDEELRILRQHYPTKGAIGVVKYLSRHGYDRSRRAVINKAHHLMLVVGDVKGYISVAALVGNARNQEYWRVLFHACRDGVLKELPSNRLKYLVPEEWGDRWVATKDERRRRKGDAADEERMVDTVWKERP